MWLEFEFKIWTRTRLVVTLANMAPEDQDFPTVEELIENPDIKISDDSDEVYKNALQSPESDSETTYENGTIFPGNLPDAEAYPLVSLLFKYF